MVPRIFPSPVMDVALLVAVTAAFAISTGYGFKSVGKCNALVEKRGRGTPTTSGTPQSPTTSPSPAEEDEEEGEEDDKDDTEAPVVTPRANPASK